MKLFEPLLYHAPGSAASTQRALSAIGPLPDTPQILDIGCGPGRQTLRLADATRGHVFALDLSQSSLATLDGRAREAGLERRISPVRASMSQLCFPDRAFDLIWSEGAIYCMGFSAGLQAWRRVLRPGGFLAVTELAWLRENPPDETRQFWSANYPGMSETGENRASIARAGYELIDEFALPESDWWDHYYGDLEKRLENFAEGFEGADREIAGAVAGQVNAEIETLRNSRGSYGYVFYIMRNPD